MCAPLRKIPSLCRRALRCCCRRCPSPGTPKPLLPTQAPAAVPMGESIGHPARWARIANVKPSPIANPWKS